MYDISVQKHEYGALLNQVGVIYINKLFVCVFQLKVKNIYNKLNNFNFDATQSFNIQEVTMCKFAIVPSAN